MMELGAFSVSLPVKDLATSISFYESLGFERFGGSDEYGYAIMKSGDTLSFFPNIFFLWQIKFQPSIFR